MQSKTFIRTSENQQIEQPSLWLTTYLDDLNKRSSRFILFCAPRTGSSAISNFFRDIEVSLAYEPFRPSKWHDRSLPIRHELARLSIKFDGIKHLYSHLNLEENMALLEYCREMGMTIVHLRRRNKLMAAISIILANETKVWQLQKDDPESRELYKEYQYPELLFEHIHEGISKFLEVEGEIDRNPVADNEQYFYYEDLFDSDNEHKALSMIGSLLRFLNIEKSPYHVQMVKEHFSPSQKQNTTEIYNRIPNWKQIQEHFGADFDC